MRPVEALAQIRLNPGTLDKFLESACSLADSLDAPERDKVLLAAKEARSMGQLIEHLRSLFSHQCCIELAAAGGFHQHQHQQQPAQNQQQRADIAWPQTSTLTALQELQLQQQQLLELQLQDAQFKHQNQFQQQQQQQNAYLQQAASYRPVQSQSGYNQFHWLGASSQLQRPLAPTATSALAFTDANMQTLCRAARALVSNVARVLYLTDTIDRDWAGCSNGRPIIAPRAGHQQQQQIWPNKSTVHLHSMRQGQTIMEPNRNGVCCLGGGNQQQQQHVLANVTTTCQTSPTPMSCLPAATSKPMDQHRTTGDRFDNVADYSQLLRSFGELSSELLDLGFCCLLANQQRAQTSARQTIAGQCDNNFISAFEWPAQVGPRCLLRELEWLAWHRPTATTASSSGSSSQQLQFARHKILDNHLHGRIQDMKNLFNVNRLAIDRSILLLLSASKCCLRLGLERACGLEARHSIVGQARASISIIMAVVKLSVFGLDQQPQPHSNPIWPSETHQPNPSQETSSSQLYSSSGSSMQDFDLEFNQLFINRQNDYEEEDDELETTLPSSSSGRFVRTLAKLNRFQRSLKWQQQIMDYFLLSAASSSISAHDSIDRLQLLMEPFSRAHDYASLTRALNDTFEMFHWLNELAVNDGGRELSTSARWLADNRADTTAAPSDFGPTTAPATLNNNNNLTNREVINEEVDSPPGLLLQLLGNEQEQHQQQQQMSAANELPAPSNCMHNINQQQQASFLITGPMSRQQHCASSKPPDCATTPDNAIIMDKRQLVDALTSTFLGQLRESLVERVQEFTDCAYTKHENRETIIQLVQCIKLQLNKLVKLLYRMRRRPASVNEINLALIQNLAAQFDDTCIELKLELQTVVVEQSDELDRLMLDMDIIKELKQQTLMGDCAKTSQTCKRFRDQNERLIELCKMLNQIASTNKMKMTTKSLALWFELNTPQLLASAECLSREPRSKVLKDHLWAYAQVWCSFYDDFCQLARQTAYLVHRQFDSSRTARIGQLRHQIRARFTQRASTLANFSPKFTSPGHSTQEQAAANNQSTSASTTSDSNNNINAELISCLLPRYPNIPRLAHTNNSRLSLSQPIESLRPYALHADQQQQQQSRDADSRNSLLATTTSMSNYQQQHQHQHQASGRVGASSDSPRSLDHYHGFGSNYHQILGRGVAATTSTGPLGAPGGIANPCLAGADEFGRHQHQQAALIQQQQQQFSLGFAGQKQQQPLGGFGQQHQLQPGFQHQHQQQQQFAPSNQANANLYSQQQISKHPNHPSGFELAAGPLAPAIRPSASSQLQLHHHQHQQQQFEVSARRARQNHHRSVKIAENNEPASILMDTTQQQTIAQHQADVQEHSSSRSARPRRRQAAAALPTAANATCHPNTAPVGPDWCSPNGDEGRGFFGSGTEPDLDEEASSDRDAQANVEQSSTGDSEADEIVRGAKETAQMALSMYQFIRGEGELNTTQDLFTQAELFAEEANELYKEVRCFSYKVPSGDLKRDLLTQLSAIPALVQQLQFVVKSPTVGNAATFAKVDAIIRETRSLMDAVNRVVNATMSCRQQYNMTVASRKRTRTLSPAYRSERGSLEFDGFSSRQMGRQVGVGAGMGSEPDI